jgi:uncharacterized protein
MTLPTPLPTTPSSFPDCSFFVAGPMITDHRCFVGRKDLLQSITTHLTGVQPISLNLVGEPRIGKSSLLYHFFQTWEQRVQDVSHYAIIYLSLQDANCRSRSGLYQAIAQELLSRPLVRKRRNLVASLSKSIADDSAFASVLKEWKQNRVLPALCLDEFEVLFKYRAEFDDGFYDHLRSLMDKNALMLIISSHRPIDVYRQQYSLTSKFFNQAHVLYVEELTEDEADDLTQLPASTIPGAIPALSTEDQRLARDWGGRHPFLLQLAARSLCQARHQGKDTAWARKQYEVEEHRLFEPASPRPNLWLPLWSFFVGLGRLQELVRKNYDEIKKGVIGIVIVVLVLALALVLGRAFISYLFQWLLKVLGLGG